MIVFPNCKINLGLRILRKRKDGFHDLETVFYPLALRDALEILPQAAGYPTTIDVSGIHLEAHVQENICYKAWAMLRKDFPAIPAVKIHLHKVIPSGAGLGGGSADGSFTLQVLRNRFNLSIPEEKMLDYALQLGSDCPFFIRNTPCIATGRGENMEQIDLDLSVYKIAIVNPGIHISTAWAFSSITPHIPEIPLRTLITLPPDKWKGVLLNDFEPPVFAAYPLIEQLRDKLYDMGAVYAAMTGTGSTVFGLFEKKNMPELNFPDTYLAKWI